MSLNHHLLRRPLSYYKYQFCFAQENSHDKCTALQGLPSKQPSTDFPPVSEIQLALFRLLVHILIYHDPLTSLALFQPFGLNPQYNTPLKFDEWVHQFIFLDNVVITQLQVALSTYAVGLSALGLDVPEILRHNPMDVEKTPCTLQ